MLSNILNKKSSAIQTNPLTSLFSQTPLTVKETSVDQEDDNHIIKNIPFTETTLEKEEELQAQKEFKDKHTIFVGNIVCTTSKKQIIQQFQKYGQISSVRIRSAQIESENGKISQRAGTILKKFEPESSFNCYIEYKEEESVQKAICGANQMVFQNQKIRVDSLKKNLDFKFTIFVGNLPFDIKEDKLRSYFESCGNIQYVRLIRDPRTHQGKGIGFVSFMDKESLQKSLKLNNTKIQDREIRVKKAVPAKRLEKKMRKKGLDPMQIKQEKQAALTPAERRIKFKNQQKPNKAQKINKQIYKKTQKNQKSKQIFNKKDNQTQKQVKQDKNIFAK